MDGSTGLAGEGPLQTPVAGNAGADGWNARSIKWVSGIMLLADASESHT